MEFTRAAARRDSLQGRRAPAERSRTEGRAEAPGPSDARPEGAGRFPTPCGHTTAQPRPPAEPRAAHLGAGARPGRRGSSGRRAPSTGIRRGPPPVSSRHTHRPVPPAVCSWRGGRDGEGFPPTQQLRAVGGPVRGEGAEGTERLWEGWKLRDETRRSEQGNRAQRGSSAPRLCGAEKR